MRSITFGLASICLFAGLCIAQDSQPNSDRGSVAAAAKASRGQAQVQQDKQADIRRLLEITGSGALATQSMDQMEKTIRPMVTVASSSTTGAFHRDAPVGFLPCHNPNQATTPVASMKMSAKSAAL